MNKTEIDLMLQSVVYKLATTGNEAEASDRATEIADILYQQIKALQDELNELKEEMKIFEDVDDSNPKEVARLIIKVFGAETAYLIADDLYSFRDGDFDE